MQPHGFLASRPPPALVLSAGGMFGAWQAGAWSVLARAFRPSAVIGASVGALNGWVIAGGIDPEELKARWLDPGMGGVMRRRFAWPPWSGIFEAEALVELARRLFEAFQPRIPFAATLVEVPALRRHIVRGEEMSWRHLLAACSMPLGFPPVRIDGRLYVDGGLLGALPLWACAEMGAARAVALDALPRMPSAAVRGAVRVVRALAPRAPHAAPPEVARLVPGVPLGSVRDSVAWNETRVQDWIRQGARDAARMEDLFPWDGPAVFD